MTVAERAEAGLAVLLASAVLVAATPALAAYRVNGAVPVVAGAAVGSVLIAFTGARMLRFGPRASYGLSVTGLLCLLLLADGPHPGTVARAVADGPNRILTDTLPLGGNRAALSALVLLVWVCGAMTGESAVRVLGRARAATSLAVPVLLFVVCFAVTSSAPGQPRYSGPLLLVCLAAAAIIMHHSPQLQPDPSPADDQDGAPSRRYAATTAMVASAAVAAALALLAPSVPALAGPAAGLHRRPPTVVPVITDPIGSMAELRDGHPGATPVDELTVMLSRPSTGYLAAGYLDEYDGGQWRFAADFQPTGGRVPGAPGSEALVSGDQVTQHVVVIGSLPVPLLPALDRPRFVTGLDVTADRATGMLLPQAPRSHPAYTVESVAPAVSLEGISPADGVDQTADPNALQLPADTSAYLATTLRFMSSLTGRRPDGDVAFLQDALQALRTSEKRIDPARTGGSGAAGSVTTTTAIPSGGRGTSLSEVINAVTVHRAATPEQFATFFAMIARYLGVPARVVTGFRLSDGSAGRPVPAGTYQVTNRQAWAWAEIPVQGLGWVVCDPTPDATTAVETTPPESVSAPSTTVPPLQANAVPRNQVAGGHALAPPGRIAVARASRTSLGLLIGVALAGLLLAVALIGPGQAAFRRYVRRRRRRGLDPAHLAVGAWLELLDGLERAGMRPASWATASEVAEEIGHHFGAEIVPRAQEVAATADRAVFCTAPDVSPGMAADAWMASQEICRQLLAGLDLRQRIRWSCAVGSAPTRPAGRDA